MVSSERSIRPAGESLFERVASILEQARGNVVRSVNANMVLAYWLIGREIVEEIQGGEQRAEYGRRVIEDLSVCLTERFGKGYSATTLWNFRQFYQVYSERPGILFPAGGESSDHQKLSPAGRELAAFSPQLSWSHYRALMRVSDPDARAFYELEAVECGWSKAQLERQIQSAYYQRILAHQGEPGLSDYLVPKRRLGTGSWMRRIPSRTATRSRRRSHVTHGVCQGKPEIGGLRLHKQE